MKYINGLKYPIQECVIIHNVFSIDEPHNKALKLERIQNRASLFKRPTPIQKSTSATRVHPGSTMVDRSPAHQSAVLASAPTTSTAATTKNKENPYIKHDVGKYYRCGETGHKSNECPRGRQVRVSHMCGTVVVIQPKCFQHYTAVSNLLLKVSSQEQGIQPPH